MADGGAASPGRLAVYGLPILGLSYLLFFLQFYFLKFATDTLLMAPAAVGTLFGVTKLWDAVSDPLVGSWSDRRGGRWGRRRPFLLSALPLLVLGFAMLWDPPEAFGSPPSPLWIGAGLFIFYTAFTLYMVPHLALGAELSSDSHQRTRVFGSRQIGFTLGMFAAFGAIQVATNAADVRATTAQLAFTTALAAIAVLAITPLVIRDPAARGRPGAASLRAGLRDVMRRPSARILLVVWFIENLGVGAVGTMSPFVATYLLQQPDVVGTIPAIYVLASVVSVPLWVRISRARSRRRTWMFAMGLAACAFGAMLFIGVGDVLPLSALLAVAGAAMGCGGVLSSSLLADIIDEDAAETGERKEGVYSAAMTFALKVGVAVSAAASGWVLAASGFVPNTEQSSEALLGIRLLFAGLPCAGFALGAAIFTRFPKEAEVDSSEAIEVGSVPS